MGNIRRQTITSSLLIYFGFVFGAMNTYFFTKEGYFEPSQYGLTQAMISLSQIFFSFASLGMISVMSKFYPYYYDELKENENDLLSLALTISLLGFLVVVAGGIILKPYFVLKFSAKSPKILEYYFWLFPFTFFYLIFSILEAHSSIYKKTVFPNFLREGVVRICTSILIVLYIFRVISFDIFVKLFSCIYGVTSVMLFFYIRKIGKVKFVFRISAVTKKKGKEILHFVAFVFFGIVIYTLAQQIDSITITSQRGLTDLGIFTLSQYIATIVQVPQRGIVAIATPYLAQAWKDYNHEEIRRIYTRSSINLLIISLFLFFNIWLNINDAYDVMKIDNSYETGKYVILILGLTKILDMGTGINSQLLYTSPAWKFEFYSGLVLLGISLPMNYFLVRNFGIIGAAYSNLAAISIYNFIRLYFIYYKYKMQPFSYNTIWTILISVGAYAITFFIFKQYSGWLGIVLRSGLFSVIFLSLVMYFHLTPDWKPIWNSIQQRLGKNKSS